ncbi:MAG TPA: PEP-CTERM sorting domain-containing protein [Candidatus Binatia bacterium]|jgi:hypothetical protein|nr:PEP-CTERM sorting domain-containing protein [Candidatus Binatia bacterium]
MSHLKRYTNYLAVIGALTVTGATAQISSINSAVITPRVFNDFPGATGNYINNYPTSITMGESGAFRATSGGLDRDYWAFSNNGSNPYILGAGDTAFIVSFHLTLGPDTGSVDSEAGFIIPNGMTAAYGQGNGSFPGGDLQFLAKSSQDHFIGFFGGPGFWNSGIPYVAGTTIGMKISYFQAGATGNLQFQVTDGASTATSPIEPWTGNLVGDILTGYFQIGNGGTSPGASAQSVFSGITITVPEPSTLTLLGLGVLPLMLRRRRA